jgi:xanthine dehydrogenase YagS FAD-binding subunit
MKSFEYHRATQVAQAVALLTRHGDRAAILAGGSDMLAFMKDRVEGPKLHLPEHVIDVNGIKNLGGIRDHKGGLKIGATTTLSEIAASPLVASRYPLLSTAAGQVGVPQIRNVGTLGGNLCQRPRCWYFRGRPFTDCLRKGGGDCYAQDGENQYHAIFGAGTCAMVCPSDLASALTALNAGAEIATTKGNRMIPVEQLYLRPEKNVLRETALGPGEMLLGVDIPAPATGSRGIYLKLKERQVFDFAVASVAAVVTLRQHLVSEARLVLGGVAATPFRAKDAETAVKGKRIEEAIPAACAVCAEKAQPLRHNAYKVKAVKGLMEQALSSVA